MRRRRPRDRDRLCPIYHLYGCPRPMNNACRPFRGPQELAHFRIGARAGRKPMPTYKAPVDDVQFLLYDVLHFERYDNLPGFTDASLDVVNAILGEAAKFSEEVLAPLNRVGDLEGCKRHEDGRVTTPKGFKEAYRKLRDGGWLGLSAPAEYGGQGLPATLSACVNEFVISANMAFSVYSGLVQGAVAALLTHGDDTQKQRFV